MSCGYSSPGIAYHVTQIGRLWADGHGRRRVRVDEGLVAVVHLAATEPLLGVEADHLKGHQPLVKLVDDEAAVGRALVEKVHPNLLLY